MSNPTGDALNAYNDSAPDPEKTKCMTCNNLFISYKNNTLCIKCLNDATLSLEIKSQKTEDKPS